MSKIPNEPNQTVDYIKIWITPGLVSLLGLFLWRDLSELRTDVKTLLAQSTADHTRVIQLEQDVNLLKQRVFFVGSPPTTPGNRMDAKKEDEITYPSHEKKNQP